MRFGRSTRPRRLCGHRMGVPEEWHGLPVPRVPDSWADEVADEAGAAGPAREKLLAELAAVRAELTAAPHLAAAVWVPDPDAGEVRALMVLDLLVPEPGETFTREAFRAVLEADPRTDVLVHHREIQDVELPAGEALLLREIVATAPDGLVEEHLVYTVFPPGAGEGVVLTLNGPHLELGEQLEADAAVMAESLELTSEPG